MRAKRKDDRTASFVCVASESTGRSGNARRARPVVPGAIAQLALDVVAPTIGFTSRRSGAGVGTCRLNDGDGWNSRDVNRNHAVDRRSVA